MQNINPEQTDFESPEWSEKDFQAAKPASEIEGLQPLLKTKRGRPKIERPKEAISIRLSAEILDYFKSTGKGWQSRINEALQEYIEQHKQA